MKVNIKKILWKIKEGILIGAILGFIAGKWFFPETMSLQPIMQTQGIFDPLLATCTNCVELAKTKILWTSTIIGALICGTIDYLTPEKFWRRWF